MEIVAVEVNEWFAEQSKPQQCSAHTHTSMKPSSSSLILNPHTPLPITDLIYEKNLTCIAQHTDIAPHT